MPCCLHFFHNKRQIEGERRNLEKKPQLIWSPTHKLSVSHTNTHSHTELKNPEELKKQKQILKKAPNELDNEWKTKRMSSISDALAVEERFVCVCTYVCMHACIKTSQNATSPLTCVCVCVCVCVWWVCFHLTSYTSCSCHIFTHFSGKKWRIWGIGTKRGEFNNTADGFCWLHYAGTCRILDLYW